MRYMARISYDGSKFEGFQRLKNGHGVQNELERVLTILAKEPIEIKGAGRTDALVHAYDQCIHFDFPFMIECQKFKMILNRMLCPYLEVHFLKEVDDSFHARFDVVSKTYLYSIYLGTKDVFLADYALFYPFPLKIKEMKKCSRIFLGTHDFRHFVSGVRKDYKSRIDAIAIRKYGKFLTIEVKGKAFYRYMVRSLVGALLDVGDGKHSIQEVKDSLFLKSSQRFSVAPAQGLYLKQISYK